MSDTANATVRVLCTNGLKSLFEAEGGELTRATGVSFAADYGSTKKFTEQITAGDVPDIVILTDEAIDTLIAQGKLAKGRTDLAKSFIGVAVRKGTPKPDISTTAAFIATLRAAPSIARSRLGASGQHLESLLKQFGLAEELAPNIKIYDGYAAQACANGETEIAIQQISELMPAGLDIVGPLPAELQKLTIFSAGIGAATKQRAAAKKFIAYIKDRDRAAALRAHGLEPA